MKRIFATMTAAILLAAAGFAQRPAGLGAPDPAQRYNFIAGYLNLTDSQKQQVKAIFSGSAEAREEGQGKMRSAREALYDAIKNNRSDLEIEQLAAVVGALHAQGEAGIAKQRKRLYNLLTDEQKLKFETLHQEMPGGGGRGPFGRP
ncbi:MAG: Spy/CpxP family protein refolding chaperone [Bryobacterales bacterium]|nr:Spy/CpxP family protein refolding chaperone [Bryobacterales bacterium]